MRAKSHALAPPPQLEPLRIGTAGWSIPRLQAGDFPGAGAHLERYARVLPCAEINSTFYRSPRASTYARWVASVPETFRFSVKAPKAITHTAALACTSAHLQVFLDEARSLGSRLGPLLFQLPPKLAFDTVLAETFFASLRNLHPGPVVLEPRHPTWFVPVANSLLDRFQISRAAADPALTPAAAHPGGYLGLTYYRLHGSPRTYYSAYTPEFLSEIARCVKRDSISAASVWCIFDNTAHGQGAPNALTLLNLTNQPSDPEIPAAN